MGIAPRDASRSGPECLQSCAGCYVVPLLSPGLPTCYKSGRRIIQLTIQNISLRESWGSPILMCQSITRKGLPNPGCCHCLVHVTVNCSPAASLNPPCHWLLAPISSRFSVISSDHCGLHNQIKIKNGKYRWWAAESRAKSLIPKVRNFLHILPSVVPACQFYRSACVVFILAASISLARNLFCKKSVASTVELEELP